MDMKLRPPVVFALVAAVLVGALLLALFVGGNSEQPFVAPPGSLATTQQEQDLLNIHEAYGTLKPGDMRLQRALLNSARTLCAQLDRKVTTPELWASVSASQGVTEAKVFTDFAIRSMCQQHATGDYGK